LIKIGWSRPCARFSFIALAPDGKRGLTPNRAAECECGV